MEITLELLFYAFRMINLEEGAGEGQEGQGRGRGVGHNVGNDIARLSMDTCICIACCLWSLANQESSILLNT